MDQKTLKKYLTYDKKTGIFIRRIQRGRFKPGEKAGNIHHRNNRLPCVRICIEGNNYYAHRLAWLYVYGEWPKNQIDHIDHEPMNNAIDNLRDVTVQENQRNIRLPKRNTSGYIGVSWSKMANKWKAAIQVDGKVKHLGLYSDIQEAVKVRKQAQKDYGYHENHGRL